MEDYTVNITGGGSVPDLTFTNAITPPSVRLNEPLFISCRFKNLGTGAASTPFGFYGSIQLIRPDGTIASYLLNVDRYNNVPAGLDSLIEFRNTLGIFITAGNYTLRFIADENNRIVESNETNNIFDVPLVVLPATTDNSLLKITGVTGPTTANPSATIPLSITIRNDGTLASAPDSVFIARWTRVCFACGSYPNNYALNHVVVPAIAAGATVTVNANFVLPATLRTTIVNNFQNIEPYVMLKSASVRASSSTPIISGNFGLYSFAYPIQPAAVADLALTGSQSTTTWDSLNNNIDISLTITNNGPNAAQNVAVNVDRTSVTNSITTFNGTAVDLWTQLTGIGQTTSIFTDVNAGREENGLLYTLWKIPQLASGASATATFRGKATGYVGTPQSATFYYKDLFTRSYVLYADAQNNNRTNDSTPTFTFRSVLYVENRNTPDLTLTNLTIPTPSVQQGQNLNFNVDFKNVGTGAATGNFTVKSYLSIDRFLSADDYQNGTIPTANYAAGQAVLQVAGAMNVASSVAAGSYYLIVVIDADNQITETNENNNVIVSPSTVNVTTGNAAYCTSKGVAPWELWIKNVQFNFLNNASTNVKDYASVGYSDFTDVAGGLPRRGELYTLNTRAGLSWIGNLNNAYHRAWIDFNGDKTFQDN